jgi:sirohydrochlorin cobaltochelatase
MDARYDAVILVAHGARDARWMKPFERMAAELHAAVGPAVVALSFLDFAKPTFAEATGAVRDAGAKRVLVVPLFLSGGGHVAKDIPKLIEPMRVLHPDMIFETTGAVGEEPEVAAAMKSVVERLLRG